MLLTYISLKYKKSDSRFLYLIFSLLGNTITLIFKFLFTILLVKSSRHLLFNLFLPMALPYFFETTKPIFDMLVFAYLKVRCLHRAFFAKSKRCLNSLGEREFFNYAEMVARPFFRLLARIARPFFVDILFINPCLFFLFRFVYLIVVFINNLFSYKTTAQ